MKITSFEALPMNIPLREPFVISTERLDYLPYALIKIGTDEGINGYGEATPSWASTGETQESVLGAAKLMRQFFIGMDPLDIEGIGSVADYNLHFNSSFKAGVEEALFDIKAKSLKAPLHRLFGQKKEDTIEIPFVVGMKDEGAAVKEISNALSRGFKSFKIKAGADIEIEKNVIRATRGLSSEAKIFVDANQGWKSPENAIKKIKEIERYEIEWIEQPILAADIKGNSTIRKNVGVKLMLDESIQSIWDCERAIEYDAMDIVNIKIAKTGGFLNADELIRMCDEHGKKYILGSMIESSLGTAFMAHFASCRNFLSCEACGVYLITEDTGEGLEYWDGYIRVPESPGVGIKLSEKYR